MRNLALSGGVAALAIASFFAGTQFGGSPHQVSHNEPAHGHSSSQPYAGFHARDISSLSESDIEQIRNGEGWGLALPAELNGLPGPKHVLELSEQLDLTDDQKSAIEALFAEMQVEANATGERFIEAEAEITSLFRQGRVDSLRLEAALLSAEELRAELRYIHLSRHQQTADLLTAEQIQRYTILRGYAEDPCANVPDGHSESLWREHNGCS